MQGCTRLREEYMLKLLILALILLVMPVLFGIPFNEKSDLTVYRLIPCWCCGWTIMYAVSFFLGVTGILTGMSLDMLTVVWCACMLAVSAFSVFFLLRRREDLAGAFSFPRRYSLTEAAAFLMTAGHAIVTFLMMHVDDDDIAYVAAVTTSVDTNTLMKYDAVTGHLITDYAANDMNRLVSAPLFAFYAVVSKLTGIRPAALCHTFIPPVLTFLFFAAAACAGSELFREDRIKAGLFTCFVILASMFSYVSVYTAGTFLMIRSWQGKAQIAGFILPFLFYLFMRVLRKGKMGLPETVLVFTTLSAACLMSTMGALIAAMTAAVLSAVTAILLRKADVLLKCAACLLVPLASAVLYMKL